MCIIVHKKLFFHIEIAEIKTRLTFAQVLQHYYLRPDKSMRLHCPFHEDQTPSLQVYYKTHTAFCFSASCKTGGKSMDVIDFIMYKENCTKADAIQKAIAMIGMQISSEPNQPASVTIIKPTVSRERFLQNMFTYFKNAVHSSKPAQDYLKQRGLNPVKRSLSVGLQ